MASERARQRRRLSRASARLRHAEVQQDVQRARALAKCGIGEPARDWQRWYADARTSYTEFRVEGSWFVRRGEDAALSWRRWSESYVGVDLLRNRSENVMFVRIAFATGKARVLWPDGRSLATQIHLVVRATSEVNGWPMLLNNGGAQ